MDSDDEPVERPHKRKLGSGGSSSEQQSSPMPGSAASTSVHTSTSDSSSCSDKEENDGGGGDNAGVEGSVEDKPTKRRKPISDDDDCDGDAELSAAHMHG